MMETLKYGKATKALGVLSVVSYGYGIYENFQDYEGENITKACVADSVGFGVGAAVGWGIASGAAALIASPVAIPAALVTGGALVVGIGTSWLIGKITTGVKDEWCEKKE